MENLVNKQSDTSLAQNENYEILDNVNKNESFENTRIGKRLTWRDYLFFGGYFLFCVLLASLIFGLVLIGKSGAGAYAYVVMLLVYGGTFYPLFRKKNGKRQWELLWLGLKFRRRKKEHDNIDFQDNWLVKAIGRESKESYNDRMGFIGNEDNRKGAEIANVWYFSEKLDKATAYVYKVNLPAVSAYSNTEDLVKLQENILKLTEFINEFSTYDRSHGVSIDIATFITDKFDTSVQEQIKERVLKKKTNAVALTLVAENMIMFRDINKFLSPENNPNLAVYSPNGYKLNNTFTLITIKGNTQNEAAEYARQLEEHFLEKFSVNAKFEPITWRDNQIIFDKYFNQVIKLDMQIGNAKVAGGVNGEEVEIYYTTTPKNKNLEAASNFFDFIKGVKEDKDYLTFKYGMNANEEKTRYGLVIGFKDLPNKFDIGWLRALQQSGLAVMITQKLNIQKEKTASKKLQTQIKKNNRYWDKTENLNANNEYLLNKVWANKQASMEFAQRIFDRDITLIGYRMYIVVYADTKEDIIAVRNSLDEKLQIWLDIDENKRQHYEYMQYNAFLSAFPHGTDLLTYKDTSNYMASVAVAQGYPYAMNTLFPNEGILIGIDKQKENLIFFNNLEKRLSNSYHMAIFAATGSGKSKLAQEIAMSYATFNRPVWCWFFDANGDYENLVARMNGMILQSNPNENSIAPIPEELLIKDYGPLYFNNIDDLLRIKRNGKPILSRSETYERGQGQKLLILDKTLSPTVFGKLPEVADNKNWNKAKRENVTELYGLVYRRSTMKFLINPMVIQNTKGSKIDSQTELIIEPTAFDIYNNHLEILTDFFTTLLINYSDFQLSLVEKAVKNAYASICLINVVTDTDTNEKFLSKSQSRADEISKDELLNMPHYPVMNDVYVELKKLCDKSLASTLVTEDVKNQIYYLLQAFDKYVDYVLPNGEEWHGAYSNVWNTDNKMIEFIRMYTCFITDYIAATQEQEPEISPDKVGTTKGSMGRAMFYMLLTLFRAFSVKNGLAGKALSSADQPYLMLFWDEAHNLLGHKSIQKALLRLTKEGRKYNTGCCIITQDIGDITNLPMGMQILNQLATKFYLGMGITGIDALNKIYAAIGGPKPSTIQHLLNPFELDTNVYRPDINTKPPGYPVFSPNNNDAFQIPMQTFYLPINEMITGSVAYSQPLTIDYIWHMIGEQGLIPKSNQQEKPLPASIEMQEAVEIAKRYYLQNTLSNENFTVKQTSNLIENSQDIANSIDINLAREILAGAYSD